MKSSVVIIIVAIILICNFTPISALFRENYTYSNYDGSFKFEEQGAGYDFSMGQRRYQKFLQKHRDKAIIDNRLYRTFTIKPWRFWQWSDYLFSGERFKLPYKAIR